MNRSPVARALLASAALFAAVALAGCDTDNTINPALSARAMAPISPKTLTVMAQKNMSKESPILVRLFKQESELEVWKKDASGTFALLHTFPICRWSGDLGPKTREGDRQAPEGFYTITPGLMNPASQYHLAFNLGFPNAFDRAHGRTGAHLMVHGDCSSRGCYAMTDEQVSEIYALARESFFGGQRSFQVQAYPFRMTPANMAKHRNNPNMPFWRMIKEGYDHFEVTRQEPKVDVCDKRYVFNAQSAEGFNAAAQCPAYEVPQEIASAVAAKTQQDDTQIATLIRRTPAAPIKMATDGSMHEVFAQALQGGREVKGREGASERVQVKLPGTIPDTVNPPAGVTIATALPLGPSTQQPTAAAPEPAAVAPPATPPRSSSLVARASQAIKRPAQAAAVQPTQTASAEPSNTGAQAARDFLKNLFVTKSQTETASTSATASIAKPTGLRGSAPAAPRPGANPAPISAESKPKPTPAPTAVAEAKPTPLPEAQEAAASKMANAGAVRPPTPALGYNAWLDGKPLSGSAPVVPSGSFGTGWSGLR